MVNGISGYTFRVDMEDNGEPGKGADRFRIRLSGPASYESNAFAANGGLLTAGTTASPPVSRASGAYAISFSRYAFAIRISSACLAPSISRSIVSGPL